MSTVRACDLMLQNGVSASARVEENGAGASFPVRVCVIIIDFGCLALQAYRSMTRAVNLSVHSTTRHNGFGLAWAF
jgi:hypothetical protein